MKKALLLIILSLPFSVYSQFLKQSELSIVENGTHNELIEINGRYSNLLTEQEFN